MVNMTTMKSTPPHMHTTVGEDFVNIYDSIEDVEELSLGIFNHS